MNKAVLRKVIVYFVFISVCSVMQFNFGLGSSIKGNGADLMLVLTVITAYFYGIEDGIAVAVALGLIRDMYSGRFIGLGVLILVFSAIIAAAILRKYLTTGFFSCVLQITIVSGAYYIFIGMLSFFTGATVFGPIAFIKWWALNRTVPGILFNTLASLPLIFLLRSLSPYSRKEDLDRIYIKRTEMI